MTFPQPTEYLRRSIYGISFLLCMGGYCSNSVAQAVCNELASPLQIAELALSRIRVMTGNFDADREARNKLLYQLSRGLLDHAELSAAENSLQLISSPTLKAELIAHFVQVLVAQGRAQQAREMLRKSLDLMKRRTISERSLLFEKFVQRFAESGYLKGFLHFEKALLPLPRRPTSKYPKPLDQSPLWLANVSSWLTKGGLLNGAQIRIEDYLKAFGRIEDRRFNEIELIVGTLAELGSMGKQQQFRSMFTRELNPTERTIVLLRLSSVLDLDIELFGTTFDDLKTTIGKYGFLHQQVLIAIENIIITRLKAEAAFAHAHQAIMRLSDNHNRDIRLLDLAIVVAGTGNSEYAMKIAPDITPGKYDYSLNLQLQNLALAMVTAGDIESATQIASKIVNNERAARTFLNIALNHPDASTARQFAMKVLTQYGTAACHPYIVDLAWPLGQLGLEAYWGSTMEAVGASWASWASGLVSLSKGQFAAGHAELARATLTQAAETLSKRHLPPNVIALPTAEISNDCSYSEFTWESAYPGFRPGFQVLLAASEVGDKRSSELALQAIETEIQNTATAATIRATAHLVQGPDDEIDNMSTADEIALGVYIADTMHRIVANKLYLHGEPVAACKRLEKIHTEQVRTQALVELLGGQATR